MCGSRLMQGRKCSLLLLVLVLFLLLLVILIRRQVCLLVILLHVRIILGRVLGRLLWALDGLLSRLFN